MTKEIQSTRFSHNLKFRKDDFDREWEQKNKKYYGWVDSYWGICLIDGKEYYSPQKIFFYGRSDRNKSAKFKKIKARGMAHCLKQANRKKDVPSHNDQVVIHDTWEQKKAYDNYGERTERQF